MTPRPLGLSDAREGSGTSWQPDSTPMHAFHAMAGDWTFMVHGNAFLGYDLQGSDRGARQIVSQNWLMAMARRSSEAVEIGARVMLSAEPFLLGGRGYPLLLQTGETYRGVPLHDRQHPHDLFMEAAVLMTGEVGDGVGVQVYVAPAGEPALGPVAFPHRASAASDPLAPLGHHWQDSTHISYGVLTVGVFTRQVKLEGSWFNGREPDERRYDFDLRAPDSVSCRLSVNPTDSLSLQASYGFLASPEALEPEESLHRITASATWTQRRGVAGSWATTAVWGRNLHPHGSPTSSYLLETNLDLDGHNILFGRAEHVQRTGRELAVPGSDEQSVFDMSSLALGYIHEVELAPSLTLGLGARGAVNAIGPALEPFYGTRWPLGGMIFVRVRPATMTMDQSHPNMLNHP
jgi:hypothetical protein